DDYQSDIQFGEWLRSRRMERGLTLEAAAEKAAMPVERLKGLEMGYSERGITPGEATHLAKLYGLKLEDFLAQATQ
ncbi:MAG: helix-turn-helix domain-containing protein, partial [Oligoflexia bacterium]|nr:helix-turn-helix domain-containing protein [Oligoflexia bacterium]